MKYLSRVLDQAGAEPVPTPVMPDGLAPGEQALFKQLLAQPAQGRIEQERLPVAWTRDAIRHWHARCVAGAPSSVHSG